MILKSYIDVINKLIGLNVDKKIFSSDGTCGFSTRPEYGKIALPKQRC